MSTAAERVRVAPSPTGLFHVGTARTALYNWLVAQQTGGVFILRIDDTDIERNREEWVAGILDSMDWLCLDYEGPYRQSDRRSRYEEVAKGLIESGYAYWCDCTRQEVIARQPPGSPPGYDGYCRDRGLPQSPHTALRFRVPVRKAVVVSDLVRGEVTFPPGSIEDFVIVKSNGDTLYVLANAVDDIDYRITTVIRAEEHLPTTPKAVLIHEALRAPIPRFAHLPVLVNAERKKLSKRRDRVGLDAYRELGITKEAMINYLALLGWSPGGDREFLTVTELISRFDLSHVGHSPAFFDETKLLHFNQHYIAELSAHDFADRALPFFAKEPWYPGEDQTRQLIEALASDLQTRIDAFSRLPALIRFFFDYQEPTEEQITKLADDAKEILTAVHDAFDTSDTFTHSSIQETLRELAASRGTSLRKLQAPIRLAITGTAVGPPLFSAMEYVGLATCQERISTLAARL